MGAIKVYNIQTSDKNKWIYSGYGITLDSTNTFKHPDSGGNSKNIIIFGADLSDSKYKNNKKQSILVLDYGSVKIINDFNARDFTSDDKIPCLSLHYNGSNSYLFVNGHQITKFKAKNSELIKYQMCLGGISSDYINDNNKKTGLYGNFYNFSIDYSPIEVDKTKNIHTYLIKKNNIV